ncbi:nuclease-related domain-containing protein [Bacillus sp. T3]|uniref:nuclease-related domain-containing protein n=1 Tax=Bacillus sp. T3 TaxID=467262 RepID=UPI0029819338|nr:nuclease-related domain-containing protein [Bacillus sp. T3]
MFLGERKIPLIVQKCEALIRNLPANHWKIPEINNELSKHLSGYYGECSIDYHLGKLDKEKYDIIPGLRLKNKDRYFQIDSFVLSNYFLLPIEIKYLTGDIEIDHTKGQLIQDKNGIIKVYDDPISQAQQQRMQFIQWLKEQKCPTIPVDFLVAFSNNNCHIKRINGNSNHFWKICRGINLTEKIAIMEKMYQTEYMTAKERKRLGKILLKQNEPLDIDILKRFQIPTDEVLPGVQCQTCYSRPMVYTYGTWECSYCGEKSKTAHEQLIADYFFIYNSTLTNKEFRKITNIQQRAKATRILNSMNLPHQGSNKGRVYFPFPTDK